MRSLQKRRNTTWKSVPVFLVNVREHNHDLFLFIMVPVQTQTKFVEWGSMVPSQPVLAPEKEWN